MRDTDAHAWVEAWFDKYGWVTYRPDAGRHPARSQIAALTDPPPPAPVVAEHGGVGRRGRHGRRRPGLAAAR